MSFQTQKFVKGLAIASVFALVTPAAAAGLVTVAGQGAILMAEATSVPALRPAYQGLDNGSGPARLSPLAGSDDMAWSNARSVGQIKRPVRRLR